MISAVPALLLPLYLISRLQVAHAQYQFTREYSGSTFFDRWQFYNNFDNLTNGDAIFVSSQVASSAQLAFVNAAGNAIIKVDNTSNVPFNQKRNTVRISTTDSYGVGSLWVADMLHVPFGCSVWPAWWSQAPSWPQGGEIDTFEGVNQVTNSQMALHTEPGCKLNTATASQTGLVNSTDCSFQTNSNQGCVVTDPRTQSYGAAFAAAGGGVWVTELAESGVSVWFFTRSAVPASLLNNASTVDTSTLGQPVANYPTNGCTVDTFFEPQNLILDITLCASLNLSPRNSAGNAAVFAQTCSGTCYNDFVIGPPSNYDNAYFEIKSIRTFQNPNVKASSATRTRATFGAVLGALLLWAVVG
ncbi:glycoside hydrolase family 16 protein [Gautieria morchelliformis]|nr:glycoside hydrolase family 16 protein [Gautieria morchelliformis]